MVQIIFGLLALALFGSVVWFSVRAKPLGNKPYRWATYIAITTGLVSLSFLISLGTAIQNGRVGGAVLSAILTIGCILCCVGLLRRKRFGAVMFYVTYILIFLTPALLAGIYGTRQTPQEAQQSGLFFIYYLITSWYMAKRWKLLGTPVGNSAPKSETSTKPQD
jgi:hypothetical protein